MYVPGPLTHRAQLLSGAAPVPKFNTAVKRFLESASPFQGGFPDPEACLQDENWPNRYYGPDEGFMSREIRRTNKIQGIAAVAIHARRAHIHGSIEVVVLAVANDGALHIPTRGIGLDEVG